MLGLLEANIKTLHQQCSKELNMSSVEQYDVLVLGSGEAGKYIAWHLAVAGKRTAVIERKYFGGSCPNIACLPSKNVIHGAKVASYFQRSAEFGIVKGEWSVDMCAVRERKRKMVEGLMTMHRERFEATGTEIIMGSGRFIGERTLQVALLDGGTRILRGDRIFLDTGTRATIDTTPGLAEALPLTHVEALELDMVPEHLLILGGGYVGLEFAQALRRLGSRVTIVEREAWLASREDPDVSEALQRLCQDEGIQIAVDTSVTRVEGKSGTRVQLRALRSGVAIELEGSHLLAATGRTPNTEGIGLDLAGIATAERGYIR